MQSAFLLISATTGCVNYLKLSLDKSEQVRGAWKVVSGEYDIVALVASSELGNSQKELSELIDFQESLGELSDEYYDVEGGRFVKRKFVHRVSFNLISRENGPHFAPPDDVPGSLPSRGAIAQQ